MATLPRSFGKMISDKNELLQAISTYASRACTKLRKQKSKAGVILVFIKTNRFRQNDEQYCNSFTYKLPCPSSDTSLIIRAAAYCLDKIYKAEYNYKKAGIVLIDLVPEDNFQRNLFSEEDSPKREELMKTLDKINRRFGANKVIFAVQGSKKSDWAMNCNYRSPRYTSSWQELPIATC